MSMLRRTAVAAALVGVFAAGAVQAAVTQIASPITFTRDTSINRLLVGQMSGWVNSTSDYQVGATFAMRLVSNSYNAQTNVDSWQFRLFVDPFAFDNPGQTDTIGFRMSAFGFDVNNAVGDPDVNSVTINSAGTRRSDATGAANNNIGLAGVRLGGSFPTVNPNIDVCLLTDASPSNCGSGGNAGLSPGESISGTIFTLNFTGKLAHVILDNFITRINAVAGSFGASGITLIGVCDRDPQAQYNPTSCNATPRVNFVEPSGVVPEPAVWAQLLVGFGLAGAAMRRRRCRLA